MSTAVAPAARRVVRWWNLELVASASGIIFVVLVAIGDVFRGVTALPDNTSTPQEIAEYWKDYDVGILVGHVFLNIATFFFLLFVAVLWKTLRQAEGDPAWVSLMVFSGGVLAAGIAMVVNAFVGTGGNIAKDYEMTTELATVLFHVTIVFFVAWIGFNVMQLGTALVIFRTGVFPRWLAWLALADIVLWNVSQWPIPRDANTLENIVFDWSGPVAHGVAMLWFIALSVIMTRRAGRPAAVSTPAA